MLIMPYLPLFQLMQRKGYNQKEMAAAIRQRMPPDSSKKKPGYSPTTLSNRLNGKTPFPMDEVVIIAEILSIPPDEMYDYFIKPWENLSRKKNKNSTNKSSLVSFAG